VQGFAGRIQVPIQELRLTVAKLSLIQRELKREQLAAKYAKKYAEYKGIANDAKKSDEERYAARPDPSAQSLCPDRSPSWHLQEVRPGPQQDS
jgi:hypothetical protein